MAYYERKRRALAVPFFNSMKTVQESDVENKPERAFIDFSDGHRKLRTVVRIEDVVQSEGQEINDSLERTAMLSLIDEHWTEHLRSLDEVKEGIGLRAYGQRDPLVEYKMEAFRLFSEVIDQIGEDVVTFVFRAGPLVERRGNGSVGQRSRMDRSRATARHQSAAASFGVVGSRNGGAQRDPSAKRKPVLVGEHVGRNSSCPCGSGKKYKHCHGRT